MKLFKISLKEFIFLILISAPIGAFLYLNNYNKIKYQLTAKQGFAIAENFCENITLIRTNLIDSDVSLISDKYKARDHNSVLHSDIKFNMFVRKDTQTYEIIFTGRSGQKGRINQIANEVLNDISQAEISSFNNNFKNLKLHCKSGEFKIFKIQPMEKINNEFPYTREYKNSYLCFLSILPFAILYLLKISLRYIIKLRNK